VLSTLSRPLRRCVPLTAALAAAIAAPADADQTAYVASGGAAAVFQYGLGSDGAFTPLDPPSVAAGGSPNQVAVSPGGISVYVTTGDAVAQYDVLPGGGLGPKDPATVPSASAVDIAVSRDADSAYVTNALQISQYDLGPGETLVPKSQPTVSTGGGLPAGVAVSPDGRSVYAAVFAPTPGNPASVAQYDVGAGGALIPKNPPTVPADVGPSGAVVVSADGKSVYVVNSGSDTISQYDVGARGVLTPKRVSAIGTGDTPGEIAISPDGRSAYVTNFGDPGLGGGSVSQYDVASDGSLTFKRPSTVAAGSNPSSVAVSADGSSVHITSGGSVFEFGVGVGGKLVPQDTPTVPSGATARGLALAPVLATERADVLTGTAGDDVICGLGGADVIRGLGGDDVLRGDRCGGRTSAAVSRTGGDRLIGGAGHDRLFGGAGHDRLFGGAGHDRLHGGSGRDRLHGGAGRDVIDVRGAGRDRVDCGDGRDAVRADARDRLLHCEDVGR
jgi:DNA-binding beta-propeller fold protein YncE